MKKKILLVIFFLVILPMSTTKLVEYNSTGTSMFDLEFSEFTNKTRQVVGVVAISIKEMISYVILLR